MSAGPELFNTPLETGLRVVVLLDELHPRLCTTTELIYLDFLALHSGTVSGPKSLHPDLPGSVGELVVRREIVEQALTLMRRAHLVDEVLTAEGICFAASEDCPSFVASLQTEYFNDLRERARWLAERFRLSTSTEIQGLIRERVGEWTAEFTPPPRGR